MNLSFKLDPSVLFATTFSTLQLLMRQSKDTLWRKDWFSLAKLYLIQRIKQTKFSVDFDIIKILNKF